MRYDDFLQSKMAKVEACGVEPAPVNPLLFDWQSDIVKWAIRRGRAALFESEP